jgi:hypothetical protein
MTYDSPRIALVFEQSVHTRLLLYYAVIVFIYSINQKCIDAASGFHRNFACNTSVYTE